MKLGKLELLLILVIASACSKKQDDNPQSYTGCKLLSVYFNKDSVKTYHYDANERLVLKWDIFEQGSDMSSSHYVYLNNRLAYLYRSAGDTTFFTYDGLGRIISYDRRIKSSLSGDYLRRTVLDYDQQNRVILELSRNLTPSPGKGINPDDSAVYTYENGNIKTRDDYTWYDPAYVYHYHYEYIYDSGKNYYAATGEPPVYYMSWNSNNVVTAIINGHTQYSDTIKQYNSASYPILIRGNEPYNIILSYECK